MIPSDKEKKVISDMIDHCIDIYAKRDTWYSKIIKSFVTESALCAIEVKNIPQGIGSFFSSKPDELHDFQPTSHATCMKGLGENITNVQKASTSLTDKLLASSCDQSRLADDSAELIEKQTETIKECISLASENAQKITCLQKELFQARRELLSTKLLKSPENMQAMQIYMASITEKISTYEKVEGKLLDEIHHSDTLEARCTKLTDSVVKLATQNKSQKEKIADLEQELSSHSPRGVI